MQVRETLLVCFVLLTIECISVPGKFIVVEMKHQGGLWGM